MLREIVVIYERITLDDARNARNDVIAEIFESPLYVARLRQLDEFRGCCVFSHKCLTHPVKLPRTVIGFSAECRVVELVFGCRTCGYDDDLRVLR